MQSGVHKMNVLVMNIPPNFVTQKQERLSKAPRGRTVGCSRNPILFLDNPISELRTQCPASDTLVTLSRQCSTGKMTSTPFASNLSCPSFSAINVPGSLIPT